MNETKFSIMYLRSCSKGNNSVEYYEKRASDDVIRKISKNDPRPLEEILNRVVIVDVSSIVVVEIGVFTLYGPLEHRFQSFSLSTFVCQVLLFVFWENVSRSEAWHNISLIKEIETELSLREKDDDVVRGCILEEPVALEIARSEPLVDNTASMQVHMDLTGLGLARVGIVQIPPFPRPA